MRQPPAAEFTALYRANYGRVLRFVARRSPEAGDAEDITADVFRIAWDRAREGTQVNPGWLFTTARNLLSNRDRASRRAERLHQAVAVDLRARVGTDVASDRVRATLADLDERHRSVLVLRYWDGLNAAEIAEHLDLSVSAVWVRLHRARRAFQKGAAHAHG
jgi:RNA polymerase sigma factor (sigma-70 family)